MKKLHNNHIIGTCCLLGMLSLNTHATMPPDRGPIPFVAYDKDANGLISEQEFNTIRAQRKANRAVENRPMHNANNTLSFSKFDLNKDGNLNKTELQSLQRAQMEKRHSMGKGSGQKSGMGKNKPTFSDFDLNGDGSILENEFLEARTQRRVERARLGYPMKNIGNGVLFSTIDLNGDNKVTPNEFSTHQAQHKKHF